MRESGWSRSWSRRSTIWERRRTLRPSWWIAGSLHGEDLWRVHQLGVLFVICGKASMAVTQDAQGLAKAERARVRERVVRRGHGQSASEQRLRTELVGIEALTSYDQYGDAASTQYAHRTDYVGQPINAVVVRKWENRIPK